MSQIKSKEKFQHAALHTFEHEHHFNNVGPEFWQKNPQKLKCYYDHHSFNGPIYSYPVTFEESKWSVRGVFCSPHCVLKYISTQKGIPDRCYTLFTLMMRSVYDCQHDVAPAADVEMLDSTNMDIETWRMIPKQHLQLRVSQPHNIPFRMQKLAIFGYPARSHPAYDDLVKWNQTMSEPGPMPEVIVDSSEITHIQEKDRQYFD